MTPEQVYTVAAIGGLTAALGLALVAALAVGIYTLVARLLELHDARRERREAERQPPQQHDIEICQAIEALGTTNHPKEP